MKIKMVLALGVVLAAATVTHTYSLAQTARGALNRASEAQSNFARDRNVAVRDRPHPDYEAQGIRAGAFIVKPEAALSGEYNDNIYAAAAGKSEDFIYRLAPAISIASDWSRHGLQAFARGTFTRYADYSSENTEEYAFGGVGRLDVVRGTTLTLGGDYNRITEPRTSSGSASSSIDPVQYDLTQFNAVGVREFNRLRLTARGDYREFNYDDGRTVSGRIVDQDDRDREVSSFLGRADYAVSPSTAFFVQGSVNKRNYRLRPPEAPIDRTSDGYEVLAGANFELSALVRGEVGVGYIQQTFDSPALGKISGVGTRAQLEWFPTQLTTVTLNGARTVEDSGVPGSSGYLSTNVGVQVDHELRRNVILTAQASYGDDDYDGVDRTDKRFNAGVGATYRMNRRLGVTANYNYFDQASKGVGGGQDFKVNRVSVGLVGRF